MVLKPFEHSVQKLYNTLMLILGRKSQYGVVYLDEGVRFLVLTGRCKSWFKLKIAFCLKNSMYL